MIAIVWQFEVKSGSESAFEEFYGAGGEWTAMNRHSRSYLRQLVPARPGPDLTVPPHRYLE